MPYYQTKVYFDGSHYIGIPHTEKPTKRTVSRLEEIIEVPVNDSENTDEKAPPFDLEIAENSDEISQSSIELNEQENVEKEARNKPKTRKTTRKELFEEMYRETLKMKKDKRRELMIQKLRPYFYSLEKTEKYVDQQLERKQRNLICRRIRMTRKANLQKFNYFCTFTYDDKKHTEDSFRKKLRNKLGSFANRKGWKYIGVWERSPKNQRLHFHGIFYIPDKTLPGYLIKVRDFNTKKKRMQETWQSDYFNELFGRTDFEPLNENENIGESLAYMMKYIEKTGEKIVYSKGLPQYFVSDILEEDVVCNIGLEDRKLLLFDDFTCWKEGEYVGTVSPEVIKQMPTSNV